MRLTPFNRALDGQLTYELDKKLATERREIFHKHQSVYRARN